MKFDKLKESLMVEGRAWDGEYNHPTLKRVVIRGNGNTTTVSNPKLKSLPVIGWFRNKYNMAEGWSIHELDKYDVKWLREKGIDLKGVFRTSTDRNTSIAKFDLKKGTYAFMDNQHLEDTDEIRFEKMSPYNELFLDKKEYASKF